jgi:hypothetical protein
VTRLSSRRLFDPGPVALFGIAVCLVAILVLWFVAADTPSSEVGLVDRLPLPSTSGAHGCANFATYWMDDSGAKMDPEVLQGFTNCTRNEDETWTISPSMYGARPIDEASLSDEQKSQLADLRAKIEDQTDGLQAVFPKSLRDNLGKIHSDESRSVIGHLKDGVSLGPTRSRYARLINAYMLDPRNQELADFAGWVMARKIDAFAQFRRSCLGNDEIVYLHDACRGMEDALNIRYAPFPWDLTDEALIDTYFDETVVQPAREGA